MRKNYGASSKVRKMVTLNAKYGITYSDSTTIVNTLNEQFVSVINKDEDVSTIPDMGPSTYPSMDNSLFELNTSVTRGNSLMVNKPRSRLNIRYNNFNQRVINAWNQLPERVISSTTVNGFKNNLDRHFQELHGVSMTQ